MERRQNCPVTCGSSNEVCCAEGETCCFVGPNLQAACCTPEATQTITASGTVLETSTILSTQEVSTTLLQTSIRTSQFVNSTTQTSQTTLTSVKTSTTVLSSTPSATPPADGGNSTLPLTEQNRGGWPKWEKGVVGAFAALGGLGLIVACLLLWRWLQRRKTARDAKQRQADGSNSFELIDTARIQPNHSGMSARTDNSAPLLRPRPPPDLRGRNPYEQGSPQRGPPWSADEVVPPYPASSRSSTPRNASVTSFRRVGSPSSSMRPQPQAYGRPVRTDDRPFNPVPQPDAPPRAMPRRPVSGMRPTVEDED